MGLVVAKKIIEIRAILVLARPSKVAESTNFQKKIKNSPFLIQIFLFKFDVKYTMWYGKWSYVTALTYFLGFGL